MEATQDIAQHAVGKSPVFAPGNPVTKPSDPPPGLPLKKADKLSKGDHVFQLSVRGWHKATVVEDSPVGVKIHFDGFPDAWDRVVDRSLLRIQKD